MKKIFSGFKDEQDGAIAIEACISLTLFLIVMIALYSVIQVFTVQSMISHAMQEACQSMALENYNQSMFKTGTLQQIPSKVFDWISGGHRELQYIGRFFMERTAASIVLDFRRSTDSFV